MAFADITAAPKTNVARRSEPGRRSVCFPATGLEEAEIPLSGCVGCALREAHNPLEELGVEIPYGETRHQRISEAERWNAGSLRELYTALWLSHYSQFGIIFEILYNVTAANNASQFVTYEIMDTDGGTRLLLRGPNPRSLGFSYSRTNPDWPFEGARLIYEQTACALPPGAVGRFEWPSVLADKVCPMLMSMEPPATNDAEAIFWTEWSADVRHAMSPFDKAKPAEHYYLRIYWQQHFPDDWPNLQPPAETQFTFFSRTIEAAELMALPAGRYEVEHPAGTPTRVLLPDMGEGVYSMALIMITWSSGLVERIDDAIVTGLIETTQTGPGAWETHIDLSAWQVAGVERVRIDGWAESVSGDIGLNRWQFPAHCANCQTDPSGSWDTDGGQFCAAAGDASLYASFRMGCWQPDCSRFCIGHEGQPYRAGNMARPPADMRQSRYWQAVWSRASWVFHQDVAGESNHRNFRVVRGVGSAGPSVQEMLGGWAADVPRGKFPDRWPYFGWMVGWPAGELEALTDDNGDQHGRVRAGAFYRRGVASEHAWQDDPTDAASPEMGAAPGLVPGWAPVGQLGDAAALPYPIGCGCTGLYDWTTGGSWMGQRTLLEGGHEYFAVALGLDLAVDAELNAEIQGLF